MAKERVLVTGMSGLIGGLVRKELESDYELSALNRSDVPGVPTTQASVSDLDGIRPAFDGIDKVVHLAAIAHGHPGWDELLKFNVIGTYNVFEAAQQAGVKRIVSASSGAAISGCEREEPYAALASGRFDDVPGTWDMITHRSLTRPSGLYGCTKVWGEALARYFTDTTEMSILSLRIGAVTHENRPTSTRHVPVWCSHRDIARMVKHALEAPEEVKFDIFFVISNNRWGYRDMAHAKEVLGFEPEDSADDF